MSFFIRENIGLYLLNVAEHSFARLFFVMGLNGCDDRSVGIEGCLPSASCLERLFPAVAQYLHQARDKFLQGVILCRFADREMKLRIGVDSGLTLLHLIPLVIQKFFQPLDVALGGALS